MSVEKELEKRFNSWYSKNALISSRLSTQACLFKAFAEGFGEGTKYHKEQISKTLKKISKKYSLNRGCP